MLFKKKKDTSKEITYEWLIEVGVPPIFASIIIKRIEELTTKTPGKRTFEANDFKTIPIWPKDQKSLAEMVNKALND